MYYRLTVTQKSVTVTEDGKSFMNENEIEFASPFLTDLTEIIDDMESVQHDDGPRHDGVLGGSRTITSMSYNIDTVAGKLERKDAPAPGYQRDASVSFHIGVNHED